VATSSGTAVRPGEAPAEALIHLDNVSKTYSRQGVPVQALHGVDLTIAPGEFVAVMGRSGSGKSTLLHILGLLDAEYDGIYRLSGHVVSGLSADELSPIRNREIGFVFQQFHLLPQLSIVENVALPALYAGRPRQESVATARRRLEQMGLEHRLEHRPTEISIGQKQRAAIARALVNEPKVILADEPTGALDSKTAKEILAILGELNREGATLVLVTHDPEVGAVARRVVRIVDGQTSEGTV
jgi:ABC-type lipoprotein export system ATPase subunit